MIINIIIFDFNLIIIFTDIDLHHAIKKENVLKNIHKSYIMYQLFKAVNYIHSGRVIHRDLKVIIIQHILKYSRFIS